MKVAVLMPAYNAALHVEAALDSLLDQEGADCLDVIVADDGSTDGTPEIVERVAAARGRVRLMRGAHEGVSVARNRALDAVTPDTDLIGFLDADDLWPEGRLRQDLDSFAADPELGLVYGAMLMFLSPEWDRPAEPDEPESILVRGINLGAGMFRAGLIRQVGRFDEEFGHGEDMDFLLRVLEQEPKHRIFTEARVHYRRHGRNMTRDLDKLLLGLQRALARSMRRRRGKGGFRYPSGIFDAENFKLMPRSW